ncbi:MAG: hypothetical protein Q8L66_13615 [Caulobacter sp.]|nr:hypothetical protein [Caulobacter sp.]
MPGASSVGVGITHEEFEGRRREIALRLLQRTDELLVWDLKFNDQITELVRIMLDQMRANPRLMETNSDLQALIKELEARAQGGASGADIVGGDFLGELWDTIKGIVTGEKELIVRIIEHIFKL